MFILWQNNQKLEYLKICLVFIAVVYNHNLLSPDLLLQKARLSTILFAENCEITHGQLCELLKYAVLGKSSFPKPRYEMNFIYFFISWRLITSQHFSGFCQTLT